MQKRDLQTLIGFILFITGFVALTLALVGIRISFLAWMDNINPVFGFVMKLVMILAGLIIVVLAQGNDYEPDDRWEPDPKDN
ncbi:MAG: hypothetical protein HKN87_18030 [Saprospiraceae bacterium]|nr:hypothetical protein [Saprospiraceae bacterium]